MDHSPRDEEVLPGSEPPRRLLRKPSSTESFLQSHDEPLSTSIGLGVLTGSTCVFVGYPFDTVKVRLQSGKSMNKSMFSSLYRGVSVPLRAVVPSWAATFFLYGAALKQLGSDDLGCVAVAGGVAGFGYSLIICPFEFVKCNVQNQSPNMRQTMTNFTKQAVAERGIGVLYRGYGACMFRDVGQNAAYEEIPFAICAVVIFTSYRIHHGATRSTVPLPHFLFVAGQLVWCCAPVNVFVMITSKQSRSRQGLC